MDYEKKQTYEVIVIARDQGHENQGLQATAVVLVTVINVNDNPPLIDVVYYFEGNIPRISESAQKGEFLFAVFSNL